MEASATVTKLKSLSKRKYPTSKPAEPEFPSNQESEFPTEPEAVSLDGGDVTKRDALAAPKYAATLAVVDQGTLDHAHDYLRTVKSLADQIAQTFDPHIARAHEQHKSLLAEKKKFTAPLEQAESIIKRTIAGYLAAEDRKRREAEAERAKQEAETRRIAEVAMEKARAASRNGNEAKADEILNAAAAKIDKIEAAPAIVPDKPEASGLALTTTWKFSIVDPNMIPREYLVPDETRIGRIVRAMKDETNIPGVRVWSEKSVSSRM